MTSDIEKLMFTERELATDSVQEALALARLVMNATDDLLVAADAQGLSNAALSRIIGVSRSNIHRQLRGDRNMTLRTLNKLAFALGLEARVTFSPRSELITGRETTTVPVRQLEETVSEQRTPRAQRSASRAARPELPGLP